MVRCIITIIVSVCLIALGSVFENVYMKKSFSELHNMLDQVGYKIENKSVQTDDILSLQNLWLEKKSKLHAFVPHTELKEVDLWISECVTYVKYKKFEDAGAKIEVVRELTEQIPRNFILQFENLF